MAKILIVDDDSDASESLVQFLGSGYEISCQTSPDRAKKEILTRGYDLVICDTEFGRYPNLYLGFNLMKAVREEGVNVPFIGSSMNDDYRGEWESLGALFVHRVRGLSKYSAAVKQLIG